MISNRAIGTRRLSEQQRKILCWLLLAVRSVADFDYDVDDIVWHPHTTDKEHENCWRASLSRSLARLERQGLIIRVKGPQNLRTVGVRFTDLGRRAAESLSPSN